MSWLVRLYVRATNQLGCCGCGCVIGPSIALIALGSGGFLTWQVVT
jgi:hypothetical protein